MITVSPVSPGDPRISQIARGLRQDDIREIQSSTSVPPEDAVEASAAASSHLYIVERDGLPVAVFGAAPCGLPGLGVAWMVGTEGMLAERLGIARRTRPFLDEITATYPVLWNRVDARNAVSIRWLRWGGFEAYGPPSREGEEGVPFYTFARITYVH